MIRERIAVAFPGAQKVGLSLWIIDDSQITRVAVGSVGTDVVGAYLERFKADTLVIESHRPIKTPAGPFRATADSIVFAHPSWHDTPMRAPLGQLGMLGQNAWRMGFNHLVRRGPYRLGRLDIALLTPEWLEAFSPPRRTREG